MFYKIGCLFATKGKENPVSFINFLLISPTSLIAASGSDSDQTRIKNFPSSLPLLAGLLWRLPSEKRCNRFYKLIYEWMRPPGGAELGGGAGGEEERCRWRGGGVVVITCWQGGGGGWGAPGAPQEGQGEQQGQGGRQGDHPASWPPGLLA